MNVSEFELLEKEIREMRQEIVAEYSLLVFIIIAIVGLLFLSISISMRIDAIMKFNRRANQWLQEVKMSTFLLPPPHTHTHTKKIVKTDIIRIGYFV